jgi:hypothetical protein
MLHSSDGRADSEMRASCRSPPYAMSAKARDSLGGGHSACVALRPEGEMRGTHSGPA